MALVAVPNFFYWDNAEVEEIPIQQLADDWRDYVRGIVMKELYGR